MGCRIYVGILNQETESSNSREAEPRNLRSTLFNLDEIYARIPSLRNLRQP